MLESEKCGLPVSSEILPSLGARPTEATPDNGVFPDVAKKRTPPARNQLQAQDGRRSARGNFANADIPLKTPESAL